MKILLIHPFIQLGGGELVIIKLANYFAKTNCQVGILCCYVDKQFIESLDKNVTIHTPTKFISALTQKSRTLLIILGFPYLLFKTISLTTFYDILFPHNFPSIFFAFVAKILFHKKIVWEYNEGAPLPKFLYFLEKVSGRFADKIIVLDNKNKKVVKNRFDKIASVLRPGIDFDYWSQPTIQEKKYASKILLLSVGKLHPQKNQILLLDILDNLLQDIPSLHLTLVGKGPDEKRIKKRAEELGLTKHVTLSGIVSNSDLRKLYKSAFLVCFPALDQTWGLTPFEALCQKTISIVSSEAGAIEVLGPENIALIANPNVTDFSEKILKAYNQKKILNKMGEKGYLYVKNHITWEEFCKKALSIIKS